VNDRVLASMRRGASNGAPESCSGSQRGDQQGSIRHDKAQHDRADGRESVSTLLIEGAARPRRYRKRCTSAIVARPAGLTQVAHR